MSYHGHLSDSGKILVCHILDCWVAKQVRKATLVIMMDTENKFWVFRLMPVGPSRQLEIYASNAQSAGGNYEHLNNLG